jgi:hypothetical protein
LLVVVGFGGNKKSLGAKTHRLFSVNRLDAQVVGAAVDSQNPKSALTSQVKGALPEVGDDGDG